MVLGIASVVLFNVVDTYWVSRLGDPELAAMTYTFPVVSVVMSLAMGLGIGTTSVVARAIGQGDDDRVRRLTTDSLLLSLVLVVVFALVGILTIRPLFGALGANSQTVEMLRDYMLPWYLGIGLIVIPIVGNSAVRATGDTKSPSLIMMVAGFVNMALDPIFIFGFGPIPRMELQGAAIATVISFGITTVAALYLLGPKLDMLRFRSVQLATLWQSWRQVITIGIPAAAANMLVPLSAGILTRILSEYGQDSVAGFGVATRIESLAMIGIGALSSSIAPFVGQNYGANQQQRVREAVVFTFRAAMVFGVLLAVVLAIFAAPIAQIFSESTEVTMVATHYLRIVPVGYGLLGVCMLVSSSFNAVNKPIAASSIIAARLFLFAVPLALLGAWLLDVPGIFAGIVIGNVIMGAIAWRTGHREFAMN